MANKITWKEKTSFCVGDTIKVHQNIIEGEKQRTQIFEGLVIGIKGHQGLKSFTVRKIATSGVGVEKIFPLETPTVIKIEVVKKGKVRRAKLYYLRSRVGKKAVKVQDIFVKKVELTKEELAEQEKLAKLKKEQKEAQEKEKRPEKTKEERRKIMATEVKEKRKKKKKKKTARKERRDIR